MDYRLVMTDGTRRLTKEEAQEKLREYYHSRDLSFIGKYQFRLRLFTGYIETEENGLTPMAGFWGVCN